MPMTYTTLVASKSTTGSIASSVNYSKLDVEAILEEAQSLIYGILRVREMRSEWVFGMSVGQSEIALPASFLDPIGHLFNITNNSAFSHRIETDISSYRSYEQVSGTLGTNPFTTTIGLSTVNVNDTAHGLTQGSTVTILGATTVDAFNLNATWPVTQIIDANNFTIDIVDTVAVASVTGGGAAATYTANKLASASPSVWSIWDEKVKFDTAFDEANQFKQLCYRRPKSLSSSNTTNWLTSRYPKLLRVACSAAAADFMKDGVEYQKHISALNALIQTVAVENDMIYRGSDFGTDTP